MNEIENILLVMFLLFMLDLASKKCVPCSSKELRAMTEETANILIQRVWMYILFPYICIEIHYF